MKQVTYRAGYKYQLAEPYEEQLLIYPAQEVGTEWISLAPSGKLLIAAGYAWDGPSGPTIDTSNSIRGSLVHDALYQLIRLKKLSPRFRVMADEIYERICWEDTAEAAWGWRHLLQARTWIQFRALRLFGAGATEPEAERPVLYAP